MLIAYENKKNKTFYEPMPDFLIHGVVPSRFQTYFIENPNNQIFFAYGLTVYGLIDYVGQGLTIETRWNHPMNSSV